MLLSLYKVLLGVKLILTETRNDCFAFPERLIIKKKGKNRFLFRKSCRVSFHSKKAQKIIILFNEQVSVEAFTFL